MRALSSRKWSLLVIAGAALFLWDGVAGANFTWSGSVCRNFNAAEATDIDYLINGVRNINPATRSVICPVPYTGPLPSGRTTFNYELYGRNSSGISVNCTMYTASIGGTFLASQSANNAADPMINLYVFQPAQVPSGADLNILCSIPGNPGMYITTVTSLQ